MNRTTEQHEADGQQHENEDAEHEQRPQQDGDKEQPDSDEGNEGDEDRPDDEDADDVGDDPAARARREAAKHRRRLREVEAERNVLRTELDTWRRAVVDQHLDRNVSRLSVTRDAFWAHLGGDVTAVLDENGRIDRAAVRQVAGEARERFGTVPQGSIFDEASGKRRQRWPDMGQGNRGSSGRSGSDSESVFSEVRTGR